MPRDKIGTIKAIAIANKACGGDEIDKDVMRVFMQRLERFSDETIMKALDRCIEEISGNRRLTPADIIKRVGDGRPGHWDGRPGAEEAWAMIPHDEAATVVWTEEMSSAFGEIRNMECDKVAKRMSFLEVYRKLVSEARMAEKPVRWTPSLGHKVEGREGVIIDAVNKGRLPQEQAQKLLPDMKIRQLPDGKIKALPAPEPEPMEPGEAKELIAGLKDKMGMKF
jgi:hypothetical protein